MRRAVPWLVGALLVAAAGVAVAATPPEISETRALEIRGAADEAVTGRTLTAQVLDASFADRVTVSGGWGADGRWLVVSVAASAPRTEVDAAIRLATLTFDGRVFQASERPGTSLLDTDLRVGTDTVGLLAFELPADADAEAADLRLSTTYSTPQLDDILVIPIALDAVPTVAEIEIVEPEWVWS